MGRERPSFPGPIYRFGPYEADASRGELRKFGVPVPLERKPWAMLATLLERPGELVTRSELHTVLWPDGTFVDFEHGLNVAVKKLREALCDSRTKPQYIETIPGQGYRFIAPVHREAASNLIPSNPIETVEETKEQETTSPSSIEAASHHDRRRPPRWIWVPIAVLVLGLLVVGGTMLRKTKALSVPHATDVQLRRFLYVADYSGNGVLAYAIDSRTGALRQVGSSAFKSGEHPYFLAVLEDDFLYVANRGRTDTICGRGCTVSGYAIDPVSGALDELDGSPYPVGAEALALAVHPSRKFLYVTSLANDLHVYERQPDGGLKQIGDSIPVGARPFFVALNPSGRFLYVANQDDASISAFAVGEGGALTPVPGSPFHTGLRPRAFLIHPNGRFAFVANYGVEPYENRDAACVGEYGTARGRGCTISVFSIDPESGSLSEIPGSPFASDGTNPLAAVMDPAGKYLFVANITSNNVSVFQVDGRTGAIRPVPGSPFAVGNTPTSLTLDVGGFLYVLNTDSRTISEFSVDFSTGRLISVGSAAVPALGSTSIVAQHLRMR